jgi:hypothetical protein
MGVAEKLGVTALEGYPESNIYDFKNFNHGRLCHRARRERRRSQTNR